jgi:hypothetical protein
VPQPAGRPLPAGASAVGVVVRPARRP